MGEFTGEMAKAVIPLQKMIDTQLIDYMIGQNDLKELLKTFVRMKLLSLKPNQDKVGWRFI